MRKIKQTYRIKASLSEVWQALTNPKYIDEWGGGPAKMSDRVGAKFSLWDGSIWGKNIEVISQKKLVQEWYSENEGEKWEKPSIATFVLTQEKDDVRIDFVHENVPEKDLKNIEDGWREYYLGPLKSYLEKR